jgi:hypothetical protein
MFIQIGRCHCFIPSALLKELAERYRDPLANFRIGDVRRLALRPYTSSTDHSCETLGFLHSYLIQKSIQFTHSFSRLDLAENLAERTDCADHCALGVDPEVTELLMARVQLRKLASRADRPTTRHAIVNTGLLARDLNRIGTDLTDLLECARHCTLSSSASFRSIFARNSNGPRLYDCSMDHRVLQRDVLCRWISYFP